MKAKRQFQTFMTEFITSVSLIQPIGSRTWKNGRFKMSCLEASVSFMEGPAENGMLDITVLNSFQNVLLQGGLKVLEQLAKLEMGVAGSIFEVHLPKFQNQSCIDFEKIEPATPISSFVNCSNTLRPPCRYLFSEVESMLAF